MHPWRQRWPEGGVALGLNLNCCQQGDALTELGIVCPLSTGRIVAHPECYSLGISLPWTVRLVDGRRFNSEHPVAQNRPIPASGSQLVLETPQSTAKWHFRINEAWPTSHYRWNRKSFVTLRCALGRSILTAA
jgi:hypothetical protein